MRTDTFTPASRYYNTPTRELTLPDGRVVQFLERRFLPRSSRFETLHSHSVAEGERLDVITAQYLADPEQFWRLCDANDAMHPLELTETVGRRLRITLPEGITAVPYA
jgi:hypothetical protein